MKVNISLRAEDWRHLVRAIRDEKPPGRQLGRRAWLTVAAIEAELLEHGYGIEGVRKASQRKVRR